uniref:Uncharacterized protein n=1 Tax=Arundo donax TaxID=35708 RepID=A0A0A9BT80_ARUDO
MSKLTWTVIF